MVPLFLRVFGTWYLVFGGSVPSPKVCFLLSRVPGPRLCGVMPNTKYHVPKAESMVHHSPYSGCKRRHLPACTNSEPRILFQLRFCIGETKPPVKPSPNPPALADQAHRRISRRILPYLFILYIVAYLDRINLSYAALEMNKDLNFGPEVYGFGAGIFFAGYFLLEIPGSILVERWSARAWFARIMISWGILAVFTGFVFSWERPRPVSFPELLSI